MWLELINQSMSKCKAKCSPCEAEVSNNIMMLLWSMSALSTAPCAAAGEASVLEGCCWVFGGNFLLFVFFLNKDTLKFLSLLAPKRKEG